MIDENFELLKRPLAVGDGRAKTPRLKSRK